MLWYKMSCVVFFTAAVFVAVGVRMGSEQMATTKLTVEQCDDLNLHLNECHLTKEWVSKCNDRNADLFVNSVHAYNDCEFVRSVCKKDSEDPCAAVQEFYETACPEMQTAFDRWCEN